ncbi:MgtC/SapB transporter [Lachnospiraceae bacterium oral taxon 500]|nr:MgtC/SapB transporter [Lachnospiraceae bacterium oral taxon 500]
MNLIFENLRGISMQALLIKTVLALLIGGVLGIERGRKRRPAGFRTFMLVCFGSMVVMTTNMYVFSYLKVSDPVRLGAQVVSGIGFLGAGMIITNSNKNQVSGITTAASLWTAACLGLAVGVGFYELAVIGFFAVLLINSWLQTLENYLLMNSRIIRLYIEYNSDKPISALVDFSRDNRYDVLDLQIKRSKLNIEITTIILLLRSEVKRSHDEIIRSWQIIEGVQFIEEIE